MSKTNKLMKTYAKIFSKNGFTVDKDLRDVSDIKYIVSTPLKEQIVNINTLTFEEFVNIAQNYQTIDGFFGGWVTEGFVYFDISIGFDNLQEAISVAHTFGQLSIYDNVNKKVIEVLQ